MQTKISQVVLNTWSPRKRAWSVRAETRRNGHRPAHGTVRNGPDLIGASLTLVQGDITKEQVDAIVNAANAQLRGGVVLTAQFTAPGARRLWRNVTKFVPSRAVVRRGVQ